MKQVWLISLVFLAFGCAKGSDNEETADAIEGGKIDPIVIDTTTDKKEFKFANNKTMEWSGVERGGALDVPLSIGGVIFKYTHTGNDVFSIDLSDGLKKVADVTEDMGDVTGYRFIQINGEGKHNFLFETTGKWKFEIVKPALLKSIPEELSGNSSNVSGVFKIEKDAKLQFKIKNDNEAYAFRVNLYDAETGDNLKSLIDVVGSCDEVTDYVSSSDRYVILGIEASYRDDGKKWSIEIK
jgi:hypothetical protein